METARGKPKRFDPWDTANHTAAYKIFHYTFLCEVAQMHLYTEEYLSVFGSTSTSNAEWDRAHAHAPVTVSWTISAMAEMHGDGVPFRLVNTEADSLKIYEIIHRHLHDWADHIRDKVWERTVPMEDLRRFDALAKDLWPIARRHMPSASLPSSLMGRLQELSRRRGGVGRDAIPALPAGVRIDPDAPIDNGSAKEHTSVTENLAQTLKERNRPWR